MLEQRICSIANCSAWTAIHHSSNLSTKTSPKCNTKSEDHIDENLLGYHPHAGLNAQDVTENAENKNELTQD
jgi:hypothetical protein